MKEPAARRLWRLVLTAAKRIGQAQAWLILTLFYFTIVTPIAILFRLAADPLHLRRRRSSTWTVRSHPADLWRWAKAQF